MPLILENRECAAVAQFRAGAEFLTLKHTNVDLYEIYMAQSSTEIVRDLERISQISLAYLPTLYLAEAKCV